MPDQSHEDAKLVESYGIDSNHEDDLSTQIVQMAAFEHAAEAGDWKSFKRIVDQSGEVFLKLMRSADGSLAVVSGRLEYDIELTDGREIQSEAAVTWVLSAAGGDWRISHMNWANRRRKPAASH